MKKITIQGSIKAPKEMTKKQFEAAQKKTKAKDSKKK